ncbi:hypothetical protein BJP36_43760 [Moorena producens JHB]|uniref:Uncharacterized protein n=1 Tax=Moorena producens (strain JHB) TaxID=1454205 RepID=A0A9Q9STB7_MOOP1|nr:hypothetical protein BJP36_43760 [Moorena producens JHB]
MEESNPYNIAAVPRFSRPIAVHSAASSLRCAFRWRIKFATGRT